MCSIETKNQKMKIKRILPTLVLFMALALPVMVLADEPSPPTTIQGLINAVTPVVWVIFGFIVLICFVYAGVKFLTAGGSPDKLEDARKGVMYGVVGVAVGIIAYGILAIMTNILT